MAPDDAPADDGSGPPTLLVRIGVGAGLLATILGLLALDRVTGHAVGFGVIFGGASLLGALELDRLLRDGVGPIERLAVLPGLVVLTASGVLRVEGFAWAPDAEGLALALAVAAVLGAGLRRGPSPDLPGRLASSLFCLAYLWGLGRFAFLCRGLEGSGSTAGIGEAALVLAVLGPKTVDIFCYFVGRFLGRRKIIPHVSPGKTWAGFYGGLAGGALVLLAATLWIPAYGALWSLPQAGAYGIILGLVAQVGDWSESLLKRSAGVKDSGDWLPEFGGALDVIDSILLGAPLVYGLTALALG